MATIVNGFMFVSEITGVAPSGLLESFFLKSPTLRSGLLPVGPPGLCPTALLAASSGTFVVRQGACRSARAASAKEDSHWPRRIGRLRPEQEQDRVARAGEDCAASLFITAQLARRLLGRDGYVCKLPHGRGQRIGQVWRPHVVCGASDRAGVSFSIEGELPLQARLVVELGDAAGVVGAKGAQLDAVGQQRMLVVAKRPQAVFAMTANAGEHRHDDAVARGVAGVFGDAFGHTFLPLAGAVVERREPEAIGAHGEPLAGVILECQAVGRERSAQRVAIGGDALDIERAVYAAQGTLLPDDAAGLCRDAGEDQIRRRLRGAARFSFASTPSDLRKSASLAATPANS